MPRKTTMSCDNQAQHSTHGPCPETTKNQRKTTAHTQSIHVSERTQPMSYRHWYAQHNTANGPCPDATTTNRKPHTHTQTYTHNTAPSHMMLLLSEYPVVEYYQHHATQGKGNNQYPDQNT